MFRKGKTKLINAITLTFGVVFVATTVIIFAYTVFARFNEFSKESNQIRSEYQQHQKEIIKIEVRASVGNIISRKGMIETTMKKRIKKRTNEAYKIINGIYDEYKHKSREELLGIIKAGLAANRFFNDRGYYFLYGMDGEVILSPTIREYEGMHYSEIKDDEIRASFHKGFIGMQNQEHIYLDYEWKKSPDSKPLKKVAYITSFPPLGIYVGTSDYYLNVEEELKREILENMRSARYGQERNGYFYVLDKDYNMLMHPIRPSLQHQDMNTLTDPDGLKIAVEQVNVSKKDGEGYVSYKWLKPSSNKISPKISYSHIVPEWDWVIVSGVYTDDIDSEIEKMRSGIYQDMINDIAKLMLFITVISLISIFIILFIKRNLKRDTQKFISFFNNAAYSDREIDRNEIRFSEFYELAFFANKMLKDKLAAQKKLLEMATIDELTGAYNRRYFSEHIQKEYDKSKRYEQCLSLMVLDIDHFKRVNDNYGHSVGDDVLKLFAQTCQKDLRSSDIFARIGGEEFALILPQTNIDNAYELAERIRKSIEQLEIESESGRFKITVSIGIADISLIEADDPFKLYKAADEALYVSKESGRNRSTKTKGE